MRLQQHLDPVPRVPGADLEGRAPCGRLDRRFAGSVDVDAGGSEFSS